MACSVLYFMSFALYPSGVSSTKITKSLDKNSDWKLAMKKIEELQMIVKFQEVRISSLENSLKKPIDQVIELKSILKKQSVRITQLETRADELETMLKEENVAIGKHARDLLANSKEPSSISKNGFSMVRIDECKKCVIFCLKKKIILR